MSTVNFKQCEKCGQDFLSRSSLKRHQRNPCVRAKVSLNTVQVESESEGEIPEGRPKSHLPVRTALMIGPPNLPNVAKTQIVSSPGITSDRDTSHRPPNLDRQIDLTSPSPPPQDKPSQGPKNTSIHSTQSRASIITQARTSVQKIGNLVKNLVSPKRTSDTDVTLSDPSSSLFRPNKRKSPTPYDSQSDVGWSHADGIQEGDTDQADMGISPLDIPSGLGSVFHMQTEVQHEGQNQIVPEDDNRRTQMPNASQVAIHAAAVSSSRAMAPQPFDSRDETASGDQVGSENLNPRRVPEPPQQGSYPSPERSDHRTSPELAFDDRLIPYGLIVNTKYGLYICVRCKEAFTSKSVISHLTSKACTPLENGRKDKTQVTERSKISFAKSDRAMVDEISLQYGISDQYPVIEVGQEGIPPITGLPLLACYGCPHCPFSASKSRVQSHIKEMRAAQDLAHLSGSEHILEVHAQVLNTGAAKRNIRVKRRLPERDTLDPYQGILHEFLDFDPYANRNARSVPSNPRLVSSWLSNTQFHRLCQGRPHELCRKLVQKPGAGEQELEGLSKAVKDWYEQALSLIKRTDTFVRRTLNTDDHLAPLNHTPLRHHLLETTDDKYGFVVVRLIAAVLRKGFPGYNLPTSDSVKEAADRLRSDMTADNVFELLLALWTQLWPSSSTDPDAVDLGDPTICFLGFYYLNADGTFLPAKQSTQAITQLKRAINLTMLMRVHKLVEAGLAESLFHALPYVTKWQSESHPGTFHSLQSIQHLASKHSYNAISLPLIVWPKRDEGDFSVLEFRAGELRLSHLEAIYARLEKEIDRKPSRSSLTHCHRADTWS
ncbi:hypothetical protein NMY22_g9300 [Coprinellus aureogranulatus]|nr:hypothetical protein NMY22_g9300 [Coprinellus aureogranulatus]